MADGTIATTGIAAHGALRLPTVEIDSYDIELKDNHGFIGDRANKEAFCDILGRWRRPMRKSGQDPFGNEPSKNVSKKALDAILTGDDTEASAVVQSAIEAFSQQLAHVTRRFLKSKAWDKTERIVVGGGFRESRLGELSIARAEILLRDDFKVEMCPIRHRPDDAGLLGALHLAPSWIFQGFDSILAVDIGGTNIRCGVVETRSEKSPDLSKARVRKFELWRYADDASTRKGAVKRLVKLLRHLISAAEKKKLKLAPFVGIACPGLIESDGSIERGAQNLPGNWEADGFNLPTSLVEAIPRIGKHYTTVVMHNDGVVQGLSEIPRMQDVKRWGILTIGTGLGNARFTNRSGKN
ncbi:ROK family protein [Bradyrhizobium uaiense]|uniref:ROK family protein n=1 Tax=Bradyrhizobium uaiense TaxID=2594946 RepID=A0A6P1BMJ8_9BRAD|nr:ROK family protein [Bradyrhizobium uaiense]NEU99706.1 ROK family protein [Bradyrhizobium uaiense]